LFTLFYTQGESFSCKETDKLFETKVDACKLGSVLGSFLGRMFFKNLFEAADFELKCPYRKGMYKVVNYTLALPDRVPLPNNVKICMDFKPMGKVVGTKRFVRILVLRALMSYNN
jgi:Protein of unknown function (DUF1091)